MRHVRVRAREREARPHTRAHLHSSRARAPYVLPPTCAHAPHTHAPHTHKRLTRTRASHTRASSSPCAVLYCAGRYILFLVAILVGSVTWAMVVGTICGMMATADPHKIAFRQQMDSLNYFMKEIGMPEEIRMQCRSSRHRVKRLYVSRKT